MLYGKLLKLYINMAQDFLEAWLLQWPDARARDTVKHSFFFFFPGMMLAVLFCLVFFSLSLSLYMLYVYIYISKVLLGWFLHKFSTTIF